MNQSVTNILLEVDKLNTEITDLNKLVHRLQQMRSVLQHNALDIHGKLGDND